MATKSGSQAPDHDYKVIADHETSDFSTAGQLNSRPSSFPISSNFQHFFGIFLIIASSAMFGAAQTCVRYATTNFSSSPLFLAFLRGCIQFILVTIIVILLGFRNLISTLTSRSIALLILRGVLGSLSMVCKYASLSKLPIVMSTSVFSTTPVFATLYAWVFLSETLSTYDISALVLCLLGTFLIASSSSPVAWFHFPPFSTPQIDGVAFSLLAAALSAGVIVAVRAMGTKVHFLLNVFSISIGSILAPWFIVASSGGDVWHAFDFFSSSLHAYKWNSHQQYILLGIGVFSFLASMCFNKGLQLVKAGKGATLRTLDIPINYVFGALFLGELPNKIGQLVGCLLITVGIYLIVTTCKSSRNIRC